MTLKVLPTNEAKQNWLEFPCANSIIKCLEDIDKNDKSVKILLRIYLEMFTHSLQSFTKCFSMLDCLVIVAKKVRLFANVSNKETEGY